MAFLDYLAEGAVKLDFERQAVWRGGQSPTDPPSDRPPPPIDPAVIALAEDLGALAAELYFEGKLPLAGLLHEGGDDDE